MLVSHRAHARQDQPAAPAIPAITLTPIAGGLGLFDVQIELPADFVGVPTAHAQVVGTEAATTATLAKVWLPPDPLAPPDGPTRTWRARFMLGEGAPNRQIGLSVFVPAAAGQPARTLGPLTTVAEPDELQRTPDWAKGLVWYQIFPERFRNAEPRNDPHPAEQPWVYHKEWKSDWAKVDEAELEAARARHGADPRRNPLDPRRTGGSLYNVVFARRYGGDLQGVTEKLDDLHDLGIDAIYLTPVFRSVSMHKYDAADYRHIDDTLAHPGAGRPTDWHEADETADPSTWTWTPADQYVRDVMIPAVHQRGMKILFDGVWNHTGTAFWAFEHMRQHGSDSPYAAWYRATFAPNPKPESTGPDDPWNNVRAGQLLSWIGWPNRRNGDLPVFKQTREGDLVAPVKQHIFDVSKRWLDVGVDGYRLDVVPDIGVTFWTSWRNYIKSFARDALLICEVWFPAEKYFNGKGFDGQMNYPFAMAVVGWLGQQPDMSSIRFARKLAAVNVNHPAIELVQMTLLDSHDTDRLVSMLYNPGRDYDQGGPGGGAKGYKNIKPPEVIYQKALLAVAIQATYLGSPMIYYGNELGMWGADDPDNRKPVPWPDLGPMENPSENAVPGYREQYRGWLTLRRRADVGPALRLGMVRLLDTGDADVVAFERRLNDRVVLVVVNRGNSVFDASTLVSPGALAAFPAAEGLDVSPVSARVWTWVGAGR